VAFEMNNLTEEMTGRTGGPFRKIEHIGIAVRDLDEAVARYEQTMGTACYKRETVESEGVETAFFRTGEGKIELVAATRGDSPVARFLEKRGEGMHHVAFEVADIRAEMERCRKLGCTLLEGMHHVAFEVADIRAEMERCRKLGCTLLSESPKPGADNKLVAFLHPKEHHGVLIELCQPIE